ncbi:MAG: dTDP-4-dehydrorhamnose 3,5-epimerase [Xanthomonadales bacterium]|nr:dTDP-4-dehydrorhamnose 3,5-epimerase [Xanthomonadales bacterium]NIX11770.1 dTDP-4-dehydrorhamnose 3,5-epimerase [Xanthomonadales bacterium]
MKVRATPLPGVLIIEPPVHGDDRGFFMESWKSGPYAEAGLPDRFVQSNFSRSSRGVLRGLHYQYPQPQGKLVSVLEGRIFDVAVDIRSGSPHFGCWTAAELSAANHRQLYIPEGFAHGFCVLSETALVHYMCTSEYASQHDAAVAWDDPDIGVEWPLAPESVSARDRGAPLLSEIDPGRLPTFVS